VRINILKRTMVAAVLSAVWLVGMSVRANAQDQQQREHEQKQEMKKREKQERKEAKHMQHQRQHAVAGNHGNHYGRIPDDRYRAHFGHEHEFRMARFRTVEGYNRFAYNGYTFGFVQPWPDEWRRNDNVYVEYVEGGYFLCNPRYPGVRITLTIF
jgi:hypothetical protein